MENINKVVTAKEARQLVENSILASSNSIKANIDCKINEGIEKKVFSISFAAPSETEGIILKKHYESLGYGWKLHSGQRSNDYIILSW